MVGVPGRSKACRTCKQRKIACSLERPQCQICIKSKRECGGYNQERIFVMDPRMTKEPPKPRTKTKNRVVELTSHQNPGAVSTPSTSKSISRPATPPRSITDLQATIPTTAAFSVITGISSPSIRAVYREQIVSEFLHSFLPPTSTSTAGSWLASLPSHPHFTAALESTTLAISTARLGHSHNDVPLVRESLKFYIQGLWELQKALWDEKLMYRDETLAACMLLIMYEVFECPDRNIKGWEGHVRGCARLFEMRGAGSYKEGLGRKLFLSFRQLEIQQALAERRATFLAQKKWIEDPWVGQTKPLSQRLLDLMAELTECVAAGYKVLGDPTDISDLVAMIAAITDVLKASWKLDTKLGAFLKRMQKETSGPLYWTKLSGYNKIHDGGDVEVFPVAFQFPDAMTAYTCMLYWTTCTVLWSGMSFIYRFLSALPIPGGPIPPSDPSTHPILHHFPPLEHRTKVSLPAKNICQSLEFFFELSLGETAATSAVLPLKVAIEALNEDPDCVKELAWAREAFERISGKGVKILRHLGVELTDRSYLPG